MRIVLLLPSCGEAVTGEMRRYMRGVIHCIIDLIIIIKLTGTDKNE